MVKAGRLDASTYGGPGVKSRSCLSGQRQRTVTTLGPRRDCSGACISYQPLRMSVPLPSGRASVHSTDSEPLRTWYMMFSILCLMSPRRMESIL